MNVGYWNCQSWCSDLLEPTTCVTQVSYWIQQPIYLEVTCPPITWCPSFGHRMLFGFEGPLGICSGFVRDSFGMRSGSVRGPFGVRSGSVWVNFGPNFSDPKILKFQKFSICAAVAAAAGALKPPCRAPPPGGPPPRRRRPHKLKIFAKNSLKIP